MKMLIKVVAALAGLALVLVLGLVVFVFTLNPNDYRPHITRLASEQGVEIDIRGQLGFSLLPRLMLSADDTSLAMPGLNASLQQLQLQLKLLPLLSGRLEFTGVYLRSPQLQFNPDLLDAGGSQNAANAGSSTQPGSLPAVYFQRIEVTDGTISLLSPNGEVLQLSGLHFQADELNTNSQPFDARGGFALQAGSNALLASPVQFQLQANVGPQRIELLLESLSTAINLQGSGLPIDASGQLDYGLNTGEISLHNARVSAGSIQLQIDAAGNGSPLNLSGSLQSARFDLAELLRSLNIDTGLSGVMQQAEVGFSFTFDGQRLRLADIAAKMDESSLSGSADISLVDPPSAVIRGQLDRLNLDRYLPQAGQPTQSAEPVDAQLAALPAHSAQLQFELGQLDYSGLSFTGVSLNLSSSSNQVRLSHLGGQLAGGSFSLSGQAGLGNANAQHQVSLNASNIAIGQVLTAFAEQVPVTGQLTASYAGTARGDRVSALKASLTGQGEVSASSLELQGIDIEGSICDLSDRIQRQSLQSNYGELASSTSLSDMRASIQTQSGLASFSGLSAAVGNIQASGSGQLNLESNSLRMELAARIAGDKTSESGCTVNRYLADRSLPLVCSGNLQQGNISCGPDSAFLEQALRSALQQGISDQIQQRLLGPGDENQPNPVRNLLEGLLRGN